MDDAGRRALFVKWFNGPPMKGDREALIRKSGLTKGRISQLFDPEQQFGERAARSLAASLGLPPEFFNTPNDSPFNPAEFTPVRRADVAFSNGAGQVVYHEDEKPPLVFRTDFLRRLGIAPGNAVVVDAEGISNEPKIVDGSVVLVNRGDKERLDGRFFAFRFDGELLIKRLERIEGVGVLATAENSNFKPKTKIYPASAEDQIEVIGHAVWTGATL